MASNEIEPGLWGGLVAAIVALGAAIRHIVRTSRPTNGREQAMHQRMEDHIQRIEDQLGRIERDVAVLKARND